MFTDTAPLSLAEVTPEQVSRVYIGSAIKCACGCSGTYWPDVEGAATPEEKAKVAEVLRKVQNGGQRGGAPAEWFGSGWSLVRGNRMFNVYID